MWNRKRFAFYKDTTPRLGPALFFHGRMWSDRERNGATLPERGHRRVRRCAPHERGVRGTSQPPRVAQRPAWRGWLALASRRPLASTMACWRCSCRRLRGSGTASRGHAVRCGVFGRAACAARRSRAWCGCIDGLRSAMRLQDGAALLQLQLHIACIRTARVRAPGVRWRPSSPSSSSSTASSHGVRCCARTAAAADACALADLQPARRAPACQFELAGLAPRPPRPSCAMPCRLRRGLMRCLIFCRACLFNLYCDVHAICRLCGAAVAVSVHVVGVISWCYKLVLLSTRVL